MHMIKILGIFGLLVSLSLRAGLRLCAAYMEKVEFFPHHTVNTDKQTYAYSQMFGGLGGIDLPLFKSVFQVLTT